MNDKNEKKKNKKLYIAIAVFTAIILLMLLFLKSCVCTAGDIGLSSDSLRNSGEKDNISSQSTATSPQTTVTEPQSSSSASSEAAPQTTSEVTVTSITASAPQTTVETTVSTPQTTVETIASTTPAVTDAPKPLWSEKKVNKKLYITVDCYSRKSAVIGSEAVSYMKKGELVNVVAYTDTGYYKLDSGSFVHSDYLSETKPAETTVPVQTEKPVTTPASSSTKPQNDTPAPSNLSVNAIGCTEQEAQVFNLINQIRRKNGLSPFMWDSDAYAVAKIRSEEITQSFSHTRPNGSDPYSLYNIEGNFWNVFTHVGENIAAGQENAQEVVNSWMESPGHRANILDPGFDNMAVALCISDSGYRYYWVQQFTAYR